MIPANEPLEYNASYRHERTGGLYVMIYEPSYICQMKLGPNGWTPCVIYRSTDLQKASAVFVRDEATFRANFTKVEP